MKRILVFLFPVVLFAQSGWIKTYGTDENSERAYWISKTNDGSYIVLGSGYQGSGVWLLKFDPSGDTLWTRQYDGFGPRCVQQTSDGGYIITAHKGSYYIYDIYLIKTDEEGNILWTSSLGIEGFQDHAASTQQTSDGGYIILGWNQRYENPTVFPGFLLIRTDSHGDTLWTQMRYGYGVGFGNCVRETSDGGYIATGFTAEIGHNTYQRDLWLIKTDVQGNTMWAKTYNGGGCEEGYCVHQTEDGGYVITGRVVGGWEGQGSNLWLFKTDAMGNVIWNSNYGEEGKTDVGIYLEQTRDTGYIILGSTYTFGGLWLLKSNPIGDTMWTRVYKGCSGFNVVQISDGDYIIAGYTDLIDGECDLMLLKVDSIGGGIPLKIKPSKILAPTLALNSTTITPKANFANISTEEYPYKLCCYCEILGIDSHNSDYRDSVFIEGGLGAFEIVSIEFRDWQAEYIGNYRVLLYVTSEGPPFPTDTMTCTFYWDPLQIEDQLVAEPGFEILTAVGRKIVLRYNDSHKGFHASIFDASGRKVDEVHSNQQTGTIRWGEGYSPGVYFIRLVFENQPAQKVILVK